MATTHRLWATSDQGRQWEMLGQPTHRGLCAEPAQKAHALILDGLWGWQTDAGA
jgi:hypothetical protein